MNKKISPQSISFIVLFLIAALGTYAALVYSEHISPAYTMNPVQFLKNTDQQTINYPATSTQTSAKASSTALIVDTASWKTYTDNRYHFSFKYPNKWNVSPAGINSNGYYVVKIITDKKTIQAQIYLSKIGYLGLDGLHAMPETLAGQSAMNYADLLYGIHFKNYYYTFDLNSAINYKAEFKKLVDSTIFPQ